jgi:hypothetical protein
MVQSKDLKKPGKTLTHLYSQILTIPHGDHLIINTQDGITISTTEKLISVSLNSHSVVK